MSGSLFIISAPSGAGKTSLVRALRTARPDIRLSCSFTTRAPRPGEVDGVHYVFTDVARFERLRDDNELLEWAHVHGNYYGTSRPWIADTMAAGHDVILEIDWQGARQVVSRFPEAVTIFILPPSMDVLRERLVGRGSDAPEVIERRLAAARGELAQAHEFQYIVVNDDLDTATSQLVAIADAARQRTACQRAAHPALFADLGIGA